MTINVSSFKPRHCLESRTGSKRTSGVKWCKIRHLLQFKFRVLLRSHVTVETSLSNRQIHLLNTTVLKTYGDSVKAIRDRSLVGDVEEFVIIGIVWETIRTANALLQREEMGVILGRGEGYGLVLEQHPELEDVVRTACQTGEFNNIADIFRPGSARN